MKKKGNISIKAKLLGIIIPVVIAIILILVFTACIIRNYRELFQKFTGIFGKQSGIKN